MKIRMLQSKNVKKKINYKLVFVLIVVGCIFYTIHVPIQQNELYQRLMHLKSGTDDGGASGDDDQDFNYNSSYFVNTIGCKMPSFPIINDHIKTYIEKVGPIKCKVPLTATDDHSMWIQLNDEEILKHFNISDADLIKCFYQSYKRLSDYNIKLSKKRILFRIRDKIKIKDEFIKVECFNNNESRLIYKDYHAFVPFKRHVEDRCEGILNDSNAKNKLNVMIVGIDSVSRLNFHRQMNQTVNYLLNELDAIEMFGYNKVGDNTFPNLIPALTGFDVDEMTASCLPFSNSSFDLCPFIWNKFADAGYRTVYAEDVSYLSTFNYFKKGFIEQPTDYYLRTYFRELEENVGYNQKLNAKLCLGGRRPTDVLLEYTKKFARSLKNKLSFSFFWECALTHDMFNYPSLIDKDYKDLFKNLHDDDFLNKTILFLMSDHGIRWGTFRNTYQGMMEERQPFLYIVVPRWFKETYPSAYRNLKKNRQKLTTHFDLYETMKDILDLPSIQPYSIRSRAKDLLEIKPVPRGISLFLPITPLRTCEQAGISSHWCTCHEHKPLTTSDAKVSIVARFAVENINQMLKKFPQCQILHLNSIKEANLGTSNDGIINKKPSNHFSDINVRFQTKPGGGEFEATVRLNSNNESFLTGSISRTNLYGKQSYCVDDYKMKLYCFCGR